MPTLLWVWTVLTAFTAIVWLYRHVQIYVARRRMPPLRADQYASAGDSLPPVSLLVAAKDEEANIDACLRSLAAQTYPHLQIIAVNDRSTDQTPRILDRWAEQCPHLSAIHVRNLREGWFGKNNAMREGLEHAAADWLAFTDADCQFITPRCVEVAMRFALEQNADFISVLPNLETNSLWERIIQPACGGILLLWFNPTRVNNPNHPAAYANGAFMLMHRDCYEAIGRHEAVKTEVNEDIHMARRAKQAGKRLLVVSNDDLYTVRMYSSLKQCWLGWSRIFYGCFGEYKKIFVSLILVFIFSLLPWLALLFASLSLSPWEKAGGADVNQASADPWSPLFWTATFTCAAQLSVMLRFYALSRSNPLFGLLYPVGAVIALGALANAARRLHGRGTTTWRGTTYRGNAVEPARQNTPAPPPSSAHMDGTIIGPS